MGRHHQHHHIDAQTGDRRVALAVVINLALSFVQIIGGIFSGSLALIADAMHNFSDAISLIIAFGARKIARRAANADMTFGYGRAEIVAALVNYTTLIMVGLYLIYEAILRFFTPQDVDGWLVIIIAGLAFLVDLATAILTYTMSKTSMNIRAAFLHNMADALGSVAVIFAGTLILLYDWRLIDPLTTLLIAGYILWQSFREIGPVIRILMLGSPPGANLEKLVDDILGLEGIDDIHHAHLWQIDEHRTALDAHLVIKKGSWRDADAIKASAKQRLQDLHGISHTTLELERSANACPAPQIFAKI
ncbi:MAG: cation diffusion facilitator family transporter [Marinosulfonomonas sp.]|nr:cation diffusion facilitator family transporter [Marinosulfonomonas sp.]